MTVSHFNFCLIASVQGTGVVWTHLPRPVPTPPKAGCGLAMVICGSDYILAPFFSGKEFKTTFTVVRKLCEYLIYDKLCL